MYSLNRSAPFSSLRRCSMPSAHRSYDGTDDEVTDCDELSAVGLWSGLPSGSKPRPPLVTEPDSDLSPEAVAGAAEGGLFPLVPFEDDEDDVATVSGFPPDPLPLPPAPPPSPPPVVRQLGSAATWGEPIVSLFFEGSPLTRLGNGGGSVCSCSLNLKLN